MCTSPEIASDTIRFTDKELHTLSKIIHNSLFKVHDGLKKLMEYFNKMVGVLCDLNLPVNWITPYGLVLHQKYVTFKNYDVTNYVMSKRQKITLRKPQDPIKISRQKQIQAFIPNFVHSMDGSNIALLINECKDKYTFNFACIHDCFATTANHAELLSHLVKQSFITIYGDGEFIKRFHNIILTRIESNYTDDLREDEQGHYVVVEDAKGNPKVHRIPNVLEIVAFDLKNELKKSEYFIN